MSYRHMAMTMYRWAGNHAYDIQKTGKRWLFQKKRVSLLSYKSTEGWTMKNPGLKDYRLNSMEEPTDEQLHALMEKVARSQAVGQCQESPGTHDAGNPRENHGHTP